MISLQAEISIFGQGTVKKTHDGGAVTELFLKTFRKKACAVQCRLDELTSQHESTGFCNETQTRPVHWLKGRFNQDNDTT